MLETRITLDGWVTLVMRGPLLLETKNKTAPGGDTGAVSPVKAAVISR